MEGDKEDLKTHFIKCLEIEIKINNVPVKASVNTVYIQCNISS